MKGWIEMSIGGLSGLAIAVACSASGGQDSKVQRSNQGGSAGNSTGGTAGSIGVGGNSGSIGVGGTLGEWDSGGGGDEGDGSCPRISKTTTQSYQPADIIWAVDTSCSMLDEAAFVQNNINQFAQQIVASGIDVRVVLIEAAGGVPFILPIDICVPVPLGSGQCGGGSDTKLPSFLHAWHVVNSNDGLNVIINTFNSWRQMLRPGATKALVIVTDDDATDLPYNNADAFIQAFTALDPGLLQNPATGGPAWSMNGIYSFTNCPGAAAVGTVWRDLIAKTGGVEGDLCTQNFQPVFNALANKIVTESQPLECQWAIPPPPPDQTFAPDRVNVEFIDQDNGRQTIIYKATDAAGCDPVLGGWYYNDSMTQVVACPASCDLIESVTNGTVNVAFGCQTELLPVPQ